MNSRYVSQSSGVGRPGPSRGRSWEAESLGGLSDVSPKQDMVRARRYRGECILAVTVTESRDTYRPTSRTFVQRLVARLLPYARRHHWVRSPLESLACPCPRSSTGSTHEPASGSRHALGGIFQPINLQCCAPEPCKGLSWLPCRCGVRDLRFDGETLTNVCDPSPGIPGLSKVYATPGLV